MLLYSPFDPFLLSPLFCFSPFSSFSLFFNPLIYFHPPLWLHFPLFPISFSSIFPVLLSPLFIFLLVSFYPIITFPLCFPFFLVTSFLLSRNFSFLFSLLYSSFPFPPVPLSFHPLFLFTFLSYCLFLLFLTFIFPLSRCLMFLFLMSFLCHVVPSPYFIWFS